MKTAKTHIPLLSALILSFFTIYFFKELFQALPAILFGAENISFDFKSIFFVLYFEAPGQASPFEYFLLYFSQLIFILLLIEISVLLLKKFPLGAVRHFLLIFTLVHLGYLLVYIFYASFLLILNHGSQNDILVFSIYLGFEETTRIIWAFVLVFGIVVYMNFITRRLLKYINL